MFILATTSPRTEASASDAGSPDRNAPKQRRFLASLFARKTGAATSDLSAKPVDFAALRRQHKAWAKHGADPRDPHLVQRRETVEAYLAWAQGQPPSAKLNDHRRRAAGILAQLMAATPQTPRTPPKPQAPPRLQAPSRPGAAPVTWQGASAVAEPSPTIQRPPSQIQAAVDTLRRRIDGTPAAGSFSELRQRHDAIKSRLATGPVGETELAAVKALAEAYERRGAASDGNTPLRLGKLAVAHGIADEMKARIERVRWRRQLSIDEDHLNRYAARLRERADARAKHAAQMCASFPDVNRGLDGASPGRVRCARGTPVYDFLPVPTRAAASHGDLTPQHGVMASVLHRKLIEHVGLDLRFPCATHGALLGAAGTLTDVVSGPEVTTLGDALRPETLQSALLTQWILGQPRAGWSEFVRDDRGQPCPKRLPTTVPSLASIARAAQQGVSPLLFHPDSGDPIPALHRPFEDRLVRSLLDLDVDALATDLAIQRDVIDVGIALAAARGGRQATHLISTPGESIAALTEPLRALQVALRHGRDLPVAMVMADAADQLEQRVARRARGPRA